MLMTSRPTTIFTTIERCAARTASSIAWNKYIAGLYHYCHVWHDRLQKFISTRAIGRERVRKRTQNEKINMKYECTIRMTQYYATIGLCDFQLNASTCAWTNFNALRISLIDRTLFLLYLQFISWWKSSLKSHLIGIYFKRFQFW